LGSEPVSQLAVARDRAPQLFDRVVCPIRWTDVEDKRPAVLATLTAAKIMVAALSWSARRAQAPLVFSVSCRQMS
jgi:xanthine/CO dehydrogenase XdhC/CoxF family maturation factor